MMAKVFSFQEQTKHFEVEIKEKDAQIARLEESYKEKAKALTCASEKFASDLLQLTSTINQREEEYRRAVDQASKLTMEEARRNAEEYRQETHRELQQERSRRQGLEKQLRQVTQDLSVAGENIRRSEQSDAKLEKELAAARLEAKAVITHLEEKVHTLEQYLDRDCTVITELRAALTDKELDYTNLRDSMDAYDEKVHVLIEHLRSWAKDYEHIGAIRSRLDMLEQIDQSCAATARIREAEQINNILSQLRQYCARQLEQNQHLNFSSGQMNATSLLYVSDEDHEKRVSDLSAFLEAEVVAHQPPSHAEAGKLRSDTMPSDGQHESINALKTSATGLQDKSSTMKPPPVLADPVINVSLDLETSLYPSSPPKVSSPVPRYNRLETRASAAQKAAMRKPVSPSGTTALRSSKRKRSTIDTGQENSMPNRQYTKTSLYFQRAEHDQAPATDGSAPVMTNSQLATDAHQE